MQVNELIYKLNTEFPQDTVLSGDRTGLQLSPLKSDIKRLMTAYELDDAVVDEAINLSVDFIVTFHPLIYFPITNIIDEDRVGRLLRKLILNDIGLFVIHTNFDTHKLGTNFLIAEKLELTNRENLVEASNGKNNIGLIGDLPNNMTSEALAASLSRIFGGTIRYCTGKNEQIKRIGILGGSGSSFIPEALKLNLDAYVTADNTYHLFHQCKGRLALFDVGHYEMEQFNSEQMMAIIRKLFVDTEIEILNSRIITNPVIYYT